MTPPRQRDRTQSDGHAGHTESSESRRRTGVPGEALLIEVPSRHERLDNVNVAAGSAPRAVLTGPP